MIVNRAAMLVLVVASIILAVLVLLATPNIVQSGKVCNEAITEAMMAHGQYRVALEDGEPNPIRFLDYEAAALRKAGWNCSVR